MKKQIKIITIMIVFLMSILVINVNATTESAICSAVFKAFKLSEPAVQGSITVTNSDFEFDEETEKYNVTLNVTTDEIADSTELTVEVEGYTLSNEIMEEELNYEVSGNTVNSNEATILITIDKTTDPLRKADITISGSNTEGNTLIKSTEVKFILVPSITLGDVELKSEDMPENIVQEITIPVSTVDIEEDAILGVKLVSNGLDVAEDKYQIEGNTVDETGNANIKILAGADISIGTYQVVISYTVDEENQVTGQAEFEITNIEINKIIISQPAISMEIGEETIISYSIVPGTFTDEDLVFTSDDETVVTIEKGGKIVAIGRGETKVKISSKDGKKEATSNVTVLEPSVEIAELTTTPEALLQGKEGSINIKIATVDLQNGKKLDISIQKHEQDVTNLFTITGNEIQNNEVNLVLTPNQEQATSGEYKVTVTFNGKQIESENLEKQTRTFKINVEKPVTEVNIDKESAKMLVDGTLAITATIVPEDAENKKIIWSSNNEEVATVDENGVITAEGKGTAIITVYSDENPEIKQTINVTVQENLIETEEYKVDLEKKLVKSIPVNTTVQALLENMQIASDEYILKNQSGEQMKEEDLITTGSTITINSEVMQLIVIGDINGDGKLSSTDLSKLVLHILEKETLTEEKTIAADMNEDEQITSTDLSRMKERIIESK